MAEQSDESPRKVRARLEKEDMLEALAIEMIQRKAPASISDHAEYTDCGPGHGECRKPAMTNSEQQAVPGDMKEEDAQPETPAEPAATPELEMASLPLAASTREIMDDDTRRK